MFLGYKVNNLNEIKRLQCFDNYKSDRPYQSRPIFKINFMINQLSNS